MSSSTSGASESPDRTAGESLLYHHSDHLGSSNIVTDQSGAQAARTEFTPYGSTFIQDGTYDPRHKFTGKELDSPIGGNSRTFL